MGTELAQAYVQIIPSAKGIDGKIAEALSGESVKAGTESGKKIASTLGKTLVAGLAVAGIGKAVSSAITAGSEYQTSLAKLGTIADTSALSMSAMSDKIREMSDTMGVSQADLAESAYQVISATGDTANALDIVSQATQLASAGFTDTASATSVLTTAMNAYHLSADQVSHISDSLLVVQNRGVTTVAELATNMGRAIATASGYSVSLENLESAYISTTKSGISTAESTTYLSSMIQELGKSGSDVSTILEQQTGQSFAQLMDSGTSLGTVLGTLYDVCGQDSEAFMNLWSSQEAGKAANAIVNQGIETFNSNLKDLQETSGTTQSAYESMTDTFAFKSQQLKTNVENLGIQLFNSVEPALESLVQKAQEFVSGLDTDKLQADMEDFADKVAKAIDSIDVDALEDDFTSLCDNVGPALDTMASAISLIADNIGLVGGALAGLGLASVVSTIGGAVSTLSSLGGAISGLATGAAAAVGIGLAPFVAILAGVASIGAVVYANWGRITEWFNSAWPQIEAGAQAFGANFVSIVTGIVSTAQGIFQGIHDTFVSVGSGLSSVASAFTTLPGDIASALSSVVTTVTSKMNSVKTTVSNAITNVKNTFTNGFNSAKTTVSTIFESIKSKISSVMESAKSAVSNAINSIKSKFNFSWSLPHLSLPHISISGSFSLNPPSAPSFSISWYDQGGIFDRPTVIGVGETRPEFVGALDDLRGIVRDESGVGSRDSLEALRAEVRAFRQEIAESNIMLDSGELVGAIVADIDRALGQRVAYTRVART